jgi:hypothetical protein
MNYVYGLYKKNITYKTNSLSEHLFYIGIASGDKNLYHREKIIDEKNLIHKN